MDTSNDGTTTSATDIVKSGPLLEYLNAARNAARLADAQYSTAGTTPILDRLQSFGQTR